MYKYVCIHCGNVNISDKDISDYLCEGVLVFCSFCGAGVWDLFDFNEHTKDYWCSENYREKKIKLVPLR